MAESSIDSAKVWIIQCDGPLDISKPAVYTNQVART